MFESVVSACRQGRLLLEGSLVMVVEDVFTHSDWFTVGCTLALLARGQSVTLIACRENYAHFLALSRKLGRPLDLMLKSKLLTYIECFQHPYCSELPLTESSPPCFTLPPSSAKRVALQELRSQAELIRAGSVVVVDSVAYMEDEPELVYWLYELAVSRECRVVLGGCTDSPLSRVFINEADVVVRMQPDVAGHGKLTVSSAHASTTLLYHALNGQLQLATHVHI